MSTSLILRRVKLQSTELAVLRALNADEIRGDPWNLAPRLLYTAERGDDAVLCIERLLDYDHPPLQTVANVVDYICQALEGLCFLHEHKIAHCAYGAEDARKLFEALCKGIDASTYDAPFQIP